jgi:hypothetical protein
MCQGASLRSRPIPFTAPTPGVGAAPVGWLRWHHRCRVRGRGWLRSARLRRAAPGAARPGARGVSLAAAPGGGGRNSGLAGGESFLQPHGVGAERCFAGVRSRSTEPYCRSSPPYSCSLFESRGVHERVARSVRPTPRSVTPGKRAWYSSVRGSRSPFEYSLTHVGDPASRIRRPATAPAPGTLLPLVACGRQPARTAGADNRHRAAHGNATGARPQSRFRATRVMGQRGVAQPRPRS